MSGTSESARADTSTTVRTAAVAPAAEPRAAPANASRRRARTAAQPRRTTATRTPRVTVRLGASTPSGMVAARAASKGTTGASGRVVATANHAAGNAARNPMRYGTSITWPLGSTGGTVLTRVVGAWTESARTRFTVWRVGTSHGPGSRRAAHAPTGTNPASPTSGVPPAALVHATNAQGEGDEQHDRHQAGHQVAAVCEAVVEDRQDHRQRDDDDDPVDHAPLLAPHRIPRAIRSCSRARSGTDSSRSAPLSRTTVSPSLSARTTIQSAPRPNCALPRRGRRVRGQRRSPGRRDPSRRRSRPPRPREPGSRRRPPARTGTRRRSWRPGGGCGRGALRSGGRCRSRRARRAARSRSPPTSASSKSRARG